VRDAARERVDDDRVERSIRAISTPSELRAYIDNAKHPGDVVTLTILRSGQEMSLPVTLGERPQVTP